MQSAARIFSAGLVVVPLLCGCQTQEQTGALVGGVGGAVAGGLIGRAIGGSTGAVIGTVVGGGAGLLIGSEIGRRLDAADRERAEYATRQALAAPVAYPSTNASYAPPPKPVVWNSNKHQDVRGTAAVTSVQRQADGGECRMVRETAYVSGEELVENKRYCRGQDGQWVSRT